MIQSSRKGKRQQKVVFFTLQKLDSFERLASVYKYGYRAGVVPNSAPCQIMHPLVLVGLGVGVGEGLGLGVGLGLGLGNQVAISKRGCIIWQGCRFWHNTGA